MEDRNVAFDHEGLRVYQLSLDLVESVDQFARNFIGLRQHLSWQIHRAATSVPLNIAESNGRFRRKDKAQFLVIATGSALECAAAVDIAERLGVGSPETRQALRELIHDIVRMLIGLTKNVRAQNRA